MVLWFEQHLGNAAKMNLARQKHELTGEVGFHREARTISSLNHPNICQLYDVGPEYLVMELVDGHPIATVETPRKLLNLWILPIPRAHHDDTPYGTSSGRAGCPTAAASY